MSTIEKKLYKEVQVKTGKRVSPQIKSRIYRGISTVDPAKSGVALYDIALVKQDIINHFHIRQGEKLENPEFGTIIWDILYEPMTDDLKQAVVDNVTQIINYDPRVRVDSIVVSTAENGIIVECQITYLTYNISEKMRMLFDENNGFLS